MHKFMAKIKSDNIESQEDTKNQIEEDDFYMFDDAK